MVLQSSLRNCVYRSLIFVLCAVSMVWKMFIAARECLDVGSITKYNNRSIMYEINVSDLMRDRLESVSMMLSCRSLFEWFCSECLVCIFKDSYTLVRKASLVTSILSQSNCKSTF